MCKRERDGVSSFLLPWPDPTPLLAALFFLGLVGGQLLEGEGLGGLALWSLVLRGQLC